MGALPLRTSVLSVDCRPTMLPTLLAGPTGQQLYTFPCSSDTDNTSQDSAQRWHPSSTHNTEISTGSIH
eukprot:jgi/Chrzof1/10601/Cz05g04280.t1